MESETATMTETVARPAGPVRLSVTRIELSGMRRPGELLFAIEEPDARTAYKKAAEWARAHGYDRLAPGAAQGVDRPAPESGWHVLINRPTSLMLLATWPWAPAKLQGGDWSDLPLS